MNLFCWKKEGCYIHVCIESCCMYVIRCMQIYKMDVSAEDDCKYALCVYAARL